MLHEYQSYDREKIRQFALKTFSEAVIGGQFSSLYQKSIQV
jgi:hypothetical protein